MIDTTYSSPPEKTNKVSMTPKLASPIDENISITAWIFKIANVAKISITNTIPGKMNRIILFASSISLFL